MTVAVDVCIKRYYHYYIEVPDGTSSDMIKEMARNKLAFIQPEELEKSADPDMEIEPQDIEWVTVDEESILALN